MFSYFDFLRWMILVNSVLSVLVVVFLVVPQYLRHNNNNNNDKAVVVPLASPTECPHAGGARGGGTSKPGNESSHWTEGARSVVPALLSGSTFMTRYPSPVFFSFYGKEGRNSVFRLFLLPSRSTREGRLDQGGFLRRISYLLQMWDEAEYIKVFSSCDL